MKKTAEELRKKIREVETNFSLDGGYTFEHTERHDVEKYAEIAEQFAAQEVAERNQQMRDFLFNMHEVENDKVVFNLSDLLQFFPPQR